MISIGFPNGCEVLDTRFRDTNRTATNEDMMRDGIASIVTGLTLGGVFINRVHDSYYTNDGCIYTHDNQGGELIGLNESKFKNFKGSINGSKTNSQFAQAVAYALKLDVFRYDKHPELSYGCFGFSKDIKFYWLTTDKRFDFILVRENLELINSLLNFYKTFKSVTPSSTYELPDIGKIFEQYPLVVNRSFDNNENFKLSEFLQYSLESVDIPVLILNGNNN